MDSKKSFKNSDELDNIPSTSGLYYFYDENEKLVYIGKAKKLKSRIREHKKCNNEVREGNFLAKMSKMNLQEESKQMLKDAIRDFEFRCLWGQTPINVDYIFHKVLRIEIEEMPHELTKELEKEMILKFEPPFNFETASEEYYKVLE